MDIYLSSSGFNLLWQSSILKTLMKNKKFWNNVDNLYGISGGATSIIYNYMIPEPEDDELTFGHMLHWWESFINRRNTKNMKYIYSSGYRWVDKWNWEEREFKEDLSLKNYYFGISHYNKVKLPLNFKWHKVDLKSFKDRTRKAMISGYVPWFVAKPDKRWLSQGMDGFFSYRGKKHFPLNEEKGTLEITANGLPISGLSGYKITQPRSSIINLWRRDVPRKELKKSYMLGRENAKEFLEQNGYT